MAEEYSRAAALLSSPGLAPLTPDTAGQLPAGATPAAPRRCAAAGGAAAGWASAALPQGLEESTAGEPPGQRGGGWRRALRALAGRARPARGTGGPLRRVGPPGRGPGPGKRRRGPGTKYYPGKAT
eukprot:2131425-Pyramimonas_sp.AAC.1